MALEKDAPEGRAIQPPEEGVVIEPGSGWVAPSLRATNCLTEIIHSKLTVFSKSVEVSLLSSAAIAAAW
jgi:hypothetical protein